MKTIIRYFLRGLLFFVPAVASTYLVVLALSTLDGLYPLPIPGLGILLTVLLITLVGFVASHVLGRRMIELVESAVARLPVVNLLYKSIKDLLGAFVGDERRFDKPVMVQLFDGSKLKVFGFVTCTSFEDARLSGHVSVYLPQSYNFAGNLIVVPQSQVQPVDADPAQFMAFIVSGGVAKMGAAATMIDDGTFTLNRPRR